MKPTIPRRPRRYLRSRITQKLILDTALLVFLSEGYAKTTIAKVSQQAEVGYGTVYSHFNGKDDILNKVVDNVLEDFYSILAVPFAPNSLEEARTAYLHLVLTAFQLAEKHRSILKVYQEALGQSKSIAAHWVSVKDRFVKSATSSFIYAQEKGLAKQFDCRIGAKAYIMLVDRFIWEIVNENENDLGHVANAIIDMLFQGFFESKGKTAQK
ncbi:MAG TPA: TetR/AcrR family transcriptional regulator [Candidatus Limnocylindrales bacterium]|nr:TetR/AcrR family transcriptional regulator [Candidatus Limnocylindrales bacterium]